jgi:hypothetical protein
MNIKRLKQRIRQLLPKDQANISKLQGALVEWYHVQPDVALEYIFRFGFDGDRIMAWALEQIEADAIWMERRKRILEVQETDRGFNLYSSWVKSDYQREQEAAVSKFQRTLFGVSSPAGEFTTWDEEFQQRTGLSVEDLL